MNNGSNIVPLRGYSTEPIFYVYLHKRLTDGSVFYVGKGKNKRAWTKKSRNNHWSNVVKKHGGFDVEIVVDNLTEQESFRVEAEQIAIYGIDNLTNQTLGGISTTGMVHSEETRKLQSEIAKKRLEDRPEIIDDLNSRLKVLHDLQRNDPEYKKKMSEKQKEVYNLLSDSEKEERAKVRNAWKQDENKLKASIEKLKATNSTEEARKRLSLQVKNHWASLTPEQRAVYSERSASIINRPDVRAKILEVACQKVVVNKEVVFKSKRQFLDYVGSDNYPLSSAFASGRNYGFSFCIFKSLLVEEYDVNIHSHLTMWNGEDIPRLDFECLPRSQAVVMDESKVFLSMKEASVFCKGKTIESTAGFIKKNMLLGKPAMGHFWRKAENFEIEKEILNRLEKLNNE